MDLCARSIILVLLLRLSVFDSFSFSISLGSTLMYLLG
ncbi:hypothetical protein RISW2_20630 [Roseivivax isoporae LMG 25204]|uniref:Uncharacterized protein n=1 Tax=Roseivivax isoporae LMG 25204 TaxID=1449351 RepID=X7F1P8_9RHOB|nr:hypothetical protein RISW2_20630 [Roseivivax isoporae LMG 25204]